MNPDGWTIDELVERAAEALADAGVHAPNGRVSATPDRRAIRWYATIGLLDPPLRTRGRTARYGQRHLLQLLAVKCRQAQGHSLAAIQAELAGATDATLRRAAGHPDLAASAPSAGPQPEPEGSHRSQFWRSAPPVVQPATGQLQSAAAQPASSGPAAGELPNQPVPPVYPVSLHPAATLTLSGPPSADDLAAIHTAARPLLDLLAARGLLPDRPTDPPAPSPSPSRRLA